MMHMIFDAIKGYLEDRRIITIILCTEEAFNRVIFVITERVDSQRTTVEDW